MSTFLRTSLRWVYSSFSMFPFSTAPISLFLTFSARTTNLTTYVPFTWIWLSPAIQKRKNFSQCQLNFGLLLWILSNLVILNQIQLHQKRNFSVVPYLTCTESYHGRLRGGHFGEKTGSRWACNNRVLLLSFTLYYSFALLFFMARNHVTFVVSFLPRLMLNGQYE